MPGPAPAEQRRRRNEPARGEWVDLKPLSQPVLPALPDGEWSDRTRAAWEAWRSDAVTSQYSESDIQSAIELAYIYEQWVRKPTVSLAGEVLRRQDRLALNPKGKRDLRWRPVPAPPEPEKPRRQSSRSNKRRAELSVVK